MILMKLMKICITVETFKTLEKAKKHLKYIVKEKPIYRGRIWIYKWFSKDGQSKYEQLEHCSI